MTDRENLEASAEQRMGGVGNLDLFGIGWQWVLEGGIMLGSRSTRWITLSYGPCFANGYVTVCCYD